MKNREDKMSMERQGKKVGILTMYYTNISHGGLLQAYSLCKKIKELGFEAEQIKYDYNERFRQSSLIKKVKIFIKKLPQTLMLKQVGDTSVQKYYSYMEEVPHSKLYRENDMQRINDDYDIFVVGSDQVWNGTYCDDYFYFPNVDKKKIAYAASVGRDNLTLNELDEMSKKIKPFSAISVREKNLQKALQNFCEKKVELVCDPVFLNGEDFWRAHAIDPKISEDYILVYLLGEDSYIKEKAIQQAKKLGKKVVTVPNVNLKASKSDIKRSDIVCWSIGPKEFLGLIKNAKLILTDSFHCTAFSIIFHRNFYCFDRGGAEKKMNSRLLSILEILGIENRFIDISSADITKTDNIEYAEVDEKLLEYKKKSEDWLINALIQ